MTNPNRQAAMLLTSHIAPGKRMANSTVRSMPNGGFAATFRSWIRQTREGRTLDIGRY